MAELLRARRSMLSRVRKLARARAFRWIEGAYVIEGPTLVSEALHSDLDIHFFFVETALLLLIIHEKSLRLRIHLI